MTEPAEPAGQNYPRRTGAVAKICALLRENPNLPTAYLVDRIGCSPHTVRAYRSLLRSRGWPIIRHKPTGAPVLVLGETAREREKRDFQNVRIDRTVLAALRPHAAKRRMLPTALIRDLLHSIVDENLIDAVLDDGGFE
jgi:hypothetical protein